MIPDRNRDWHKQMMIGHVEYVNKYKIIEKIN